MLGASPLNVDLTLVVPDGAKNKNTKSEHIAQFYSKFSQVETERFDGVVVTGAPVEHLPFEDVLYWEELCRIFDWIQRTEASMYSICWGAMASLYYFHTVPKHITATKQFGVFGHAVRQGFEITNGVGETVGIPVSRHTEWRKADMAQLPDGVTVLAEADETGPCVIWDQNMLHCHMMNHFEYDADTLDQEYKRDVAKGTPTGEPIALPKHYYPGDDPDRMPEHSWQQAGRTFYTNWLQIAADNAK